MKILHVVGARPNFMKAAPVFAALGKRSDVEQVLVHTGQHYDAGMSAVFFRQLGLPEAELNLEVGSGSHAWQTATVMIRFEPVVLDQRPDLVLVYGDVNSTLAAALVCAKLDIPVGHVEAGLRSFDASMPEETNRQLTDRVADLLFTPSQDGDENLLREGIAAEKIHFVGNVMIDTLVRLLPDASALQAGLRSQFNLDSAYGLVTLHRPSNVDDPSSLGPLLETLAEIGSRLPLVFPVHPRTRERVQLLDARHRIAAASPGLKLVDPLGYLEFLALMQAAALVITDSGGIQEETTYLGIPCLTVRENTERPVTVTLGTNQIVGRDLGLLRRSAAQILDGHWKTGQVPPLWDGQAGERVAEIIVQARR